MTKLTFYTPTEGSTTKRPLFSTHVQAGFPSPAEDHVSNTLDLNELIIQHPAATFFVEVEGDSMKNANIENGDILVIDRAIPAKSGMIIIAHLYGEFTLKRLGYEGKRPILYPDNEAYTPIRITEEMHFQIWGVVTYTIHKCLR